MVSPSEGVGRGAGVIEGGSEGLFAGELGGVYDVTVGVESVRS
ncbi:hypothetical protein STRTUCAR8_01723 [Streptomyces turgidiscabies Car8]|uniref:Uncharacterized protein n=1 Tax=Streptomyces turgidiscabies (strain Car8) TaxID=698760 RepID=L7F5C4_STRT8|nr:hypothetical protein STRTUCAR8_01723 [Streptomyces turgidiscabies Car8]